jgi:4-alpha-glucanotransferase
MHPPPRRSAGILLPAFSTRRDGDLGIGDTLALREWVDWAAEHDVGFLQMLPINEHGIDESPYSAISSAALDPIYLSFDVPEIPMLAAAEVARTRHSLGNLVDDRLVHYGAVRIAKRKLLELSWSRFHRADALLHEEFQTFREEEREWLDDYCLFRHLGTVHGESLRWDEWSTDCRTPSGARRHLAAERRRDAAAVDRRLGYFAYVQWLCHRQWRALRAHADFRGVKLMGDVPIGISWHSCDVFFHRGEFDLDWFGGSPAEGHGDSFVNQWGQNWGIPLYRWARMERNGFTWWKQRIERLADIFRIFRIDHILGFYRIFAFPWPPHMNDRHLGLDHEQVAALHQGRLPRWFQRPDDTPENMAANRADGDVRLRGILGGFPDVEVIAEDLGWVPGYVRPHLADLGIAGFRIPHWDCDEHGHPLPSTCFPELSFATYSTHDHDSLCALWRGCHHVIEYHNRHPGDANAWHADGAANTLRLLSEFAGIPRRADGSWPAYTDGIHWRLIKQLLSSNSRYAALMVTELFGLDGRINHPGSSGGENWRFRLPWSLSQIRATPHLAETCRRFASLIGVTRRHQGP